MTEITGATNSLLWLRARPRTHAIDPVAFLIAGLAAPLVPVAVVGAPFGLLYLLGAGNGVLVMPAIAGFAIVFGTLPYALLGLPLAYRALALGREKSGELIAEALKALLLTVILTVIGGAFLGDADATVGTATFLGLFGLIFAPLWMSLFAVLYRRMRRNLYLTPIA